MEVVTSMNPVKESAHKCRGLDGLGKRGLWIVNLCWTRKQVCSIHLPMRGHRNWPRLSAGWGANGIFGISLSASIRRSRRTAMAY